MSSTRKALSWFPLWLAAACAAAAGPALLAYNLAPSPTFLNQALALALWGGFVLVSLPKKGLPLPMPLLAALALLGGAVVVSWGWRGLPGSLALSALGLLFAAALLGWHGAACAGRTNAEDTDLFAAFCWAWLLAGLCNLLIGGVQVFAPAWTDGHWLAHATSPGRAVGNLRQPNHLSSLLMWACIALVGLVQLRRLSASWAACLMPALVAGVVLTASRTGVVSVVFLALWGLLDRRLNKPVRWLLMLAPLFYGLSWLAMSQWSALTQASFGGVQRLAETDISGSRFGIWSNTWSLIKAEPWAGVGFGNFNLAWTLTAFADRPVAFFDHTHNLLLQWAVELGLPWAAVVLALLLWGMWQATGNAWRGTLDASQTDRRSAHSCSVMMVLMIGLHSMLEYPLWYAYFLLPACWALGYALAPPAPPPAPSRDAGSRASGLGLAAACLLIAVSVYAVVDYRSVARIFWASKSADSLATRITAGQRSWFFGHHADYAAATTGLPPAAQPEALDRASHNLLDTRLMMAWAKHHASVGQTDKARHLAARLREFKKTEAADFFAACPDPIQAADAAPDQPFQCQLPKGTLGWQDFQFLKR